MQIPQYRAHMKNSQGRHITEDFASEAEAEKYAEKYGYTIYRSRKINAQSAKENEVMTAEVKITKEMVNAVCKALTTLVQAKGKRNGMATLEQIEEQMMKDGVTFFVPLRLTLSGLIDKSIIRYFKMENGRLVFGYTKAAQDKVFGSQTAEPDLNQAANQ